MKSMRTIPNQPTGRNHGGALHESHIWHLDTVDYLKRIEQGQLPLETWDYLEEEFQHPVARLDPVYVSMLTSSSGLEMPAHFEPTFFRASESRKVVGFKRKPSKKKRPKKRLRSLPAVPVHSCKEVSPAIRLADLARSAKAIKDYWLTHGQLLCYREQPIYSVDYKNLALRVQKIDGEGTEWLFVTPWQIHAIAEQI